MERDPVEWVQLLAQLDLLLVELDSQAGQSQFKGLGGRRWAAAVRQLRSERQQVCECAARCDMVMGGSVQAPRPPSSGTGPLLGPAYSALASSFLRAAEVARERGDQRLSRWLSQRARLHFEHDRFLQG